MYFLCVFPLNIGIFLRPHLMLKAGVPSVPLNTDLLKFPDGLHFVKFPNHFSQKDRTPPLLAFCPPPPFPFSPTITVIITVSLPWPTPRHGLCVRRDKRTACVLEALTYFGSPNPIIFQFSGSAAYPLHERSGSILQVFILGPIKPDRNQTFGLFK